MNQHLHVEEEPDLIFAPEDEATEQTGFTASRWKVLIIDDEPDIHDVTRASLTNFDFEGTGLHFLHAYSAKQAKEILSTESDIAVALVDVVMEDEDAGLNLIHHIRNDLKNKLIRLILRTGQP